MAAYKSSLARAGTMELTAEEGICYLKSAHKDTLLRVQGLIEDKPVTPRDGSMVSTAREAERFLGENRPDEDAQTRGQQKRITDASSPPVKKVRLSKYNTMAETARESKYLLNGKNLGNTRRETVRKNATKKRHRRNSKKTTAIARTLVEAMYVLNSTPDLNEGIRTRSDDPSPRYSMKRTNTMQKTASDGNAFLRRGRY